MEQLYRASRVVSGMIFSLWSLTPKNAIFRQFCLIVCSFYKMVTFATVESLVIFQILGYV